MKKRVAITMAAVAMVVVGSIGGYAFASGNEGNITKPFGNPVERAAIQERAPRNFNNNFNNCGNSGNREEMIQIMNDNGLEEMATWMENGDYEAMNDYMNNLSEEDYEKMIDLMNENGYGNMARMMESIGREGMINMHNSMMGGRGSRFNKMGRFNN